MGVPIAYAFPSGEGDRPLRADRRRAVVPLIGSVAAEMSEYPVDEDYFPLSPISTNESDWTHASELSGS